MRVRNHLARSEFLQSLLQALLIYSRGYLLRARTQYLLPKYTSHYEFKENLKLVTARTESVLQKF